MTVNAMKVFFLQFIKLTNASVAKVFESELLNPITNHAPSPPDYIRHVCKDWCRLEDRARQDNSVYDTLLPSIGEGETLKDSNTSDFRSLIQKIHLAKQRGLANITEDLISFQLEKGNGKLSSSTTLTAIL